MLTTTKFHRSKTNRVFEVGADGVQSLQVPHDSAGEAGQGGAAKDGFVRPLQTHPLQEAVAALEHNLWKKKHTYSQRSENK